MPDVSNMGRAMNKIESSRLMVSSCFVVTSGTKTVRAVSCETECDVASVLCARLNRAGNPKRLEKGIRSSTRQVSNAASSSYRSLTREKRERETKKGKRGKKLSASHGLFFGIILIS